MPNFRVPADGSQKSPNKDGPLTRGRYRKILSKSKAKRSPGKGRTSPTLVKNRTGSVFIKSRKEIADLSKLSEEEQLQKALEESKIESMTLDEQMKLAISESRKILNLASPTPPSPDIINQCTDSIFVNYKGSMKNAILNHLKGFS